MSLKDDLVELKFCKFKIGEYTFYHAQVGNTIYYTTGGYSYIRTHEIDRDNPCDNNVTEHKPGVCGICIGTGYKPKRVHNIECEQIRFMEDFRSQIEQIHRQRVSDLIGHTENEVDWRPTELIPEDYSAF